MICSWASMSTALSKLQTINHPHISSAALHLTLAVTYADAYSKVWHSIYWNDADAVTKRRVSEKLNNLAYDAFSSLLDAAECINKYVEEMKGKEEPPEWWVDMTISLTLAYDAFNEEHRWEISSRQVTLFKE